MVFAIVIIVIAIFFHLLKKENPANWKNYKNDQYGFEFQYPQSYRLDISQESSVPMEFVNINMHEPNREMPEGTPGMNVEVWNNSQHLSIVDWARNNLGFSNYDPINDFNSSSGIGETIVCGNKTLSYSWQGEGYGKTILMQNSSGTVFMLGAFANNQDDKIWQDFEKIFSTFKIVCSG